MLELVGGVHQDEGRTGDQVMAVDLHPKLTH
jgi:hypothetical protein